MLLVDAKTMQELDRHTIEDIGIPGLILMENAGLGCVEILLKELSSELSSGCLVVAGPGNNGGDGFVIARHLHQRGLRVRVLLLTSGDKYKGDALVNLKAIKGLGLDVAECLDLATLESYSKWFQGAGMIVDAIFGTGLKRELADRFAQAVEMINQSQAKVLAVDIASGLSADNGMVLGCAVQADVTVTMALPKVGHITWPGVAYTGRLHVVDIGIPRSIVEETKRDYEAFQEDEFRQLLKPRPIHGHKGTFGHLLIIGGSRGKTGAACLAAYGALRSGAGLVTVASARSSQFIIAQKLTEAMTEGLPETPEGQPSPEAFDVAMELFQGKKAGCIGPGLGLTEPAVTLSQKMGVYCPVPLVMDADALTSLAKCTEILKEAKAPRILTPHPGEMARLMGCTSKDVQADRIGAARTLAKDTGSVVVLKGVATVTAEPGGRISINTTGNPGLGTGGTGDTLAGVIGALLAQGYSAWDAARLGVYAHGRAADLVAQLQGPFGYTAREAVDLLPRVWGIGQTQGG